MTGVITSLPPLVEQPPGSNASNPAGLPGVTYVVAIPNLPQTWTALQTFRPDQIAFAGSSSGSTLLNATAIASGRLTLPAATDTLVGQNTTDTLTNKTLTSPTITGAAITGSTFNGNTWTAGTGTLTIAAAKTITISNTLTLAGTDATTMTFPTTNATIARTDAANTFTGTQTFGALVATTVNGNTITAGSATLTLTGNLTVNNAIAMSAGAAGQVGVWNSGNLSGSSTPTLGASGTLGSVTFGNATSGLVTLQPVAGALGAVTVSLPAATDTLVGKATTDTLTNKTLTSPTLTTPVLGTPTSGTLTNCTGLPLTGLASQAAFTLVGNNTSGAAAPTAFTITGLTLKGTPAAGDETLIWDVAGSAWKKATVSGIGASAGVSSIAGNTGAFTLSTGITNSTNVIKLALNNTSLQTTTASPTGTTGTAMMGLGSSCTLTPTYSTRIYLVFHGDIANSSAAFVDVQVRFGTGVAPVNGAAATGTTIGGLVRYNAAATNAVPFSVGGVLTGLTPATAYWFDLAVAVSAGTGSVAHVTCSAFEF